MQFIEIRLEYRNRQAENVFRLHDQRQGKLGKVKSEILKIIKYSKNSNPNRHAGNHKGEKSSTEAKYE